MYVLIVYDISDDRVRKRLADYLKSKGFERIQRSAFIGKPLPSVLKDVLRIIPRYIRSGRDVIHVFPVTEYTLKYMRVYGNPLNDINSIDRGVLVIAETDKRP